MSSLDKLPPVIAYLYEIPNQSPHARLLHPEAMYTWLGGAMEGLDTPILENAGVIAHPLCSLEEVQTLLDNVREAHYATQVERDEIEKAANEVTDCLQEISNLVFLERPTVTKKNAPGLVVALNNLLGTMRSKMSTDYREIIQELNVDVVTGQKHVDVWLDTPAWKMTEGEKAARFNMEIMRMPAWKSDMYKGQRTKVYCDYKGKQWQLAFASSMGWIGLCAPSEFTDPRYTETCLVSECENWSTQLRESDGI